MRILLQKFFSCRFIISSAYAHHWQHLEPSCHCTVDRPRRWEYITLVNVERRMKSITVSFANFYRREIEIR